MGGKESKQFPISSDEAAKRGKNGKKLQKLYELFYPFFVVSETEKRRLQDAFRRSSAANSIISKQVTPGNNLRIFCRINLFIFRFLSKMYWANAFLVLYQNKFLVSLGVAEVSPLENF